MLFSNLILVLERKISMRKPREELVKRGVLLEDSAPGEFANTSVSVYKLVFGSDKVCNFSFFYCCSCCGLRGCFNKTKIGPG